MAASIPRSFRLMRPGLFPPTCIIGALVMTGSSDGKGTTTSTIIRDVIMMSQRSFQNMKAHASVNLVLAPALRLGGSDCAPGFVFTDIREVNVPATEPNPEAFAKAYFLEKFGLVEKKIEEAETYSNKLRSERQFSEASQKILSSGKEKPRSRL